MKTILTAKLKLQTTQEQFLALRATQLASRDALNYVSRYAYEHGKISNKAVLQAGTYRDIRILFRLPSQMACSVARQVGATYSALWTKVRSNAAARASGRTKKRYKGLDQPPKYVSPTLDYQYRKDFSFKKHQQVSVLTLSGRIILPYTGYGEHVSLLQMGAEIGGAKLWYDKPKKQFFLLVSVAVQTADPNPSDQKKVVGVDVGVRYLATTATLDNHTQFFTGKRIKAKADHLARVRKRLQQKGTRSATRRLVALSGRERRLKRDANHTIAKRIVESHPQTMIGLEHLTDIRERTRRKKGKKATSKQRRANRRASSWSFAELHSLISYKALLCGSTAIVVDANYTSQMCPMCGHTTAENRPNKGLLFICRTCQYQLHADLIGARNVAMRTFLIRQDWVRTGVLSVRPDGASEEAKALRLQRYSELRWSSAPSSRF